MKNKPTLILTPRKKPVLRLTPKKNPSPTTGVYVKSKSKKYA